MGKTLFISDLDGTLLDSNAKITPVTARIINSLISEGLIFTYATARSFHTASKVTTGINFKEPAVHHNGIIIQDTITGEYIDRCVFERDKINQVLKKFQDNRLYPLVYSFIGGRERVSWISGEETDTIKWYLKTRQGDKRLLPVQNYSGFTGDIYEITFIADTRGELEQILHILDLDSHFSYHLQKDTYKDDDGSVKYWLEFLRFDAGKDTGVQKVKKLTGADKIVCFGDNINDIPMFNISDESYAVENALPEIKKIATAVIASNSEDGVAKWLEKNARRYLI